MIQLCQKPLSRAQCQGFSSNVFGKPCRFHLVTCEGLNTMVQCVPPFVSIKLVHVVGQVIGSWGEMRYVENNVPFGGIMTNVRLNTSQVGMK